ncbi:putative transcription factor NAM family [Helianthus anomalus]
MLMCFLILLLLFDQSNHMEVGEDFLRLPPGFRFHPSDEELIVHYLFNKVKLRSLPAEVIGEIELYKFDPWDLPSRALFGKDEWFFFTPRDRRYPNGSRPKRSAGSGFWKATGKDKSIIASSGVKNIIGLKKALVFFTGKPNKNKKTNWIMNEYRLPDPSSPSRQNGSMRVINFFPSNKFLTLDINTII